MTSGPLTVKVVLESVQSTSISISYLIYVHKHTDIYDGILGLLSPSLGSGVVESAESTP